jgi:hypothetical protein
MRLQLFGVHAFAWFFSGEGSIPQRPGFLVALSDVSDSSDLSDPGKCGYYELHYMPQRIPFSAG